MVVDFSKINLKERPMLVLKTQSDEVIQTLGYAFNVEADLMYNEVSTLTFDLPAYTNGVKTPNYDEVKGTRIIDFVGVGLFILVDPTTENDGVSEIKHCKAYSLEYEFTKKQFYIAGNEDDPDEDGNVGYKMVYKFYDSFDGVSNTETIIGRIHEKMPEWTFEIVDADLYDKYRTFDSDVSDNVYNFIKSTVQETYGCIFDFDTYNRHVKVISTESAIAQRQVFLSQENLIKKIDINEDSDSVVTSLDVSGEEGVSIRFVNPTGQNNIYDLHYFLDELPASLRTKWNEWTAACEAQRQNYFNLAMSYQVKIADILTEQVKLVDLQGELRTAETIQGAEVSKPDSKQSDLSNAKAEVTRATNAVNAQQSVVNTKTAAKDSVLDSIKAINYSLAWEPVRDSNGNIIGGPWKDSKGQAFTAAELKTLRRYFFEDSVEDSSFALATTNSYTNKDVGSGLKNITINITNDSRKIERANSSSLVYSFAGGKITVGTNPNYVAAKIVRGTAEVDPSTNKVILTAYLERGDYSQTDFEDEGTGRTIFDCGTITLTGTYTKMSYNGSATQEGIFAGTSLILEGANVQVYFSKNTSEFEQYSVEWDLFNYGKEILEERSEPSYTFTVESGNFLVIDDFFQFQNDLKLGQRVYLNLDDTKKVPFVTSVHLNYEDLSDFKIEFCNTYRASDSSFRLSQLLEQSIRLGKSLNIKGGMYSQFQATGAQNAVKEFMNSALDIAKNNVLSSENQAITFDESGLRLRKWKDKDAGTYEDEQIWMNDNTIAFTDDNWSTAKMAIGKIIDTSLFGYVKTGDKKRDTSKTYYTKQSDGTYIEWTGSTTWNTNLYEKGYAYGIAAPYLVGTVLAGSNLIITANDHKFKIDGSGIRIKTNSLLITNKDDTDPKTFEQTQEETKDAAVKDANVYTDGEFDDFMQVYDHGDDGLITTFYSSTEPLEAEKGDLWYYENTISNMDDTSTGGHASPVTVGTLKRCTGAYILKGTSDTVANRVENYITIPPEKYEWLKKKNKLDSGAVYYVITYNSDGTISSRKIYQGKTDRTSTWSKKLKWELVRDEDAVRAVQSAANAKFIADKRINTFYSDTEPDGVYVDDVKVIPLGHGDLWYKTVPTPPGDIKPGDTDERTSPKGDGRKFGKMYWYDKESDPDNPSWEPVTDGEVLRFITENANSIRNDLKQLMAVMDDKMNVFFIDDTKAFPTISGDELDDDDILFREGKNNRSWKPASTTYTTEPNHVYRIKVTTSVSTGAKTVSNVIDITKELDNSTKESLRMARSFQNTVDKKGTIYARPTPPGSQDGDETMNASDDGDLWICTRDSNDPPVKSNLVSGGEYRGGKMYRWDTSKWYVIEDPDLDAKATELGRRMKELMQVLDPGDTDMNLFWMLQNDTFSTITAGAQNGDLLFFAGTKNKTVTVNGTSKTLNPDSLYRIVVEENVITALNKETDADAKDAIKSARNFQNFTDHKSRVYAQPQPPDTSTMKETDNGDIWICTFTSGEPISQGSSYIGGKMYRFDYNGGNGRWVEIHDPDLDKEVFDYGQTIRELMQAMDNQINVYELGAGDAVPTIAKGLEDGDIIYVKSDAGNKTISINGKSETLQAGHLYRIFTDGSKVTGKEEITDDNAKKAIIAAGSWKNLEDKKVTVYVLDHLPGTATGETPLKKADGGDIWFCTKDIDTDGDGKANYVKDKIYRMVWSNGVTWVLVDPYSGYLEEAFESIEKLREGLDNKITTFYQNTEPTDAENGDLWYYNGTKNIKIGTTTVTKGKVYRLKVTGTEDNPTKVWEELTDPKIAQALENAAQAQNTADGKAHTWWATEPPIPQEGDDGDLWYCTLDKGKSGYSDYVYESETGNPPKNYFGGRLYYCAIIGYEVIDEHGDGTTDIPILAWKLLEDKVLAEQIDTVSDTLEDIYNGQTLVKDKFPKTIEAQYMAMKAAGGNVVYDSYGVWLLDKATNGTSNTNKANATEAVWMNEDGILFGHSAKTGDVSSDYEKEMSAADSSAIGLSNKKWYWTTAINHAGITAKALVGQTLQGVHILGDSDLQIGAKTFGNDIKYAFKVDENGQIFAGLKSDGSDYNFKVDKDGNVTVNGNGTFTGRIEGDSGYFKGTLWAKNIVTSDGSDSMLNNSGQIKGDYLELKGINIYDDAGNLAMSASGNNGIKMYKGSISWDDVTPPEGPNMSGYLTESELNNTYNITHTSIDGVHIESPKINAGEFYGASYYDSNSKIARFYVTQAGSGSSFNFGYNFGSREIDVFQVQGGSGVTSLFAQNNKWLDFYYSSNNNATWAHGKWIFEGDVEFQGSVDGISATATFG